MRARYYSPELLHFINADVVKGSIADGDTLNRYAFVLGNPVSFVDPFGLSADLAANRYVEGKYSYSSVYEEITEFISSIDPEEVHLVLDVTGFVEVYRIGTVSDAVNTIWYITEGNWSDDFVEGASKLSKRAGRELGKTKFGSRVTEEAVKAKRRVYGWFDNISGYFSREGKNAAAFFKKLFSFLASANSLRNFKISAI